MHKARVFFFVCAGLFLLALSYHLGARSAGAQAPSGVECVALDSSNAYAVIGGYLYTVDGSGGLASISAPVPGHAVACAGSQVVLDNGQRLIYFGGQWNVVGTFPFGSATPAQSISIGQLKAKYATPAGK